jgi:hypothetical protein
VEVKQLPKRPIYKSTEPSNLLVNVATPESSKENNGVTWSSMRNQLPASHFSTQSSGCPTVTGWAKKLREPDLIFLGGTRCCRCCFHRFQLCYRRHGSGGGAREDGGTPASIHFPIWATGHLGDPTVPEPPPATPATTAAGERGETEREARGIDSSRHLG